MVTIDVLVWVWVWCSTLATILLPFPSILEVHQKRTVGSTPIVPLLSLLANCHVWSMYGFLGKAWFPNFPAFVIGDIISWCYIFVYWKYSEDRRRVARYVALVGAALAVPTFYVTIGFLGFTGQQRVQVWETHGLCFCDFTVLFTSIFTVQNLLQSFKHKSVASINVRALVVGTSYSSGWITYGHLYSNWIIAGPQVWIMTLHTASWVMVLAFSRENKTSTTRNDMFQALSPI